jgi:hypothetical protein
MKMKTFTILSVCGLLVLTSSLVRATSFTITFSSGDTTLANGSLLATPEGGGLFEATSGTLTVPTATLGLPAATYTLLPDPFGSMPVLTLDSSILYDDLLSYPAAPGSSLTDNGLVFNGTVAGKYWEINLYTYGFDTLYVVQNKYNALEYGNFSAVDPPSGDPIPDGGVTAGLLGGALIGLQAWRRKRF